MSRAIPLLLEYFDAPAAGSFTLPPAQAIGFFKAKGLKTTFDWRDMLGDEHAAAFTVAKMADLDMLADVQASLADAIEQGLSYQSWSDTIIPLLQQKGWWGRQAVTDPLTGETIIAQLGSPSRLKTIFRTNVQSAYAAGQWQQIQEQSDVAEFLMYDALDDHRTRPEHAAWDGTVLPVGNDWWNTHYPPNGWNCRCGVIQLSAEDLEDLGIEPSAAAPAGGKSKWTNPRTGKVETVDQGLDPGWNSNPGKTHLAKLQQLQAEKIKAMPPASAKAAAQGVKAAEAQAQAAAEAAGVAVGEAMEATAAQLASGAGKAQTRAAQAAIAKALNENTPNLAKAIKALQGTKAGKAMDPVELLATAKAKALEIQNNNALYAWKQAQLQGKPGPAAGKAVFDGLPEEAQASILADIEAKVGAQKAAKAIDDEIAAIAAGDHGPVVAANLKAVQAETPGLPPAEILAKVKALPAQLTKGQQSGGLAGWKKNAIAGKPPTDKQQLAFDTLSPTQKAKALQDVQDAKDAQNAAAAAPAPAPDSPAAPPAIDPDSISQDDLKGWLADTLELDEDSLPDVIDDAYLTQIAESGGQSLAQLKADIAADLTPYIPGAPPIAPIAKAAAADIPVGPVPVSEPVPDFNPGSLRQIGPQKGSNPGGVYVDEATGTEWYVKFPASQEVAANEYLAGQLYRLAGVDVPDTRITQMPDGRWALASRIEHGLVKSTADKLAKGGAFDGFAVDAWLANWDVAGASMDNLLLRGAQAFRVDVGGSLRYRAQGGLKGSAWGDEVTELQSLRNAGTAPQAAKVFGKMTDADIEASIAKVLAIDEGAIRDLVTRASALDPAERDRLIATLLARRESMARQFPGARRTLAPEAKPDAQDTARVTAREQDAVVESRVNGYTFRTDGDAIEDQNVVVSVITSASGKPVTRVFLKVRGSGDRAVMGSVNEAGAGALNGVDLAHYREKILAFVKSANTRAAKGQVWDSTMASRVGDLTAARGSILDQLAAIDSPEARAMVKRLDAMHAEVMEYVQPLVFGKLPMPAFRQVDISGEFKDVVIAAKAGASPDSLPWRKAGQMSYELADFKASNARMSGRTQMLEGANEHYAIDEPGYRVKYVPDSSRNAVASRGMVMIEVDGAGAGATAQGFQILERMGVKATRSSQADRLELYLDRIAYLRTIRNAKLDEAYQAAGKIADPTARADAKLRLLNADAGRDMTKSRYWNPDGEHQAFGHGRVIMNRPDLDDAEVAAFARDHVVYHNTSGLGVGGSPQWERLKSIIEGGGQIGSQVDRVRRGVPSFGSSVSSDHSSGGANYIFTRLRTRASGMDKAGIYWNPERLMRRSDAFTYTGDRFGRVSRDTQNEDRQIDPAGWRRAAKNRSNETNFRDSLSVFDDVERIVLASRAEYNEAIGGMRALGYRTWPDGRALEDVFSYEGKKP